MRKIIKFIFHFFLFLKIEYSSYSNTSYIKNISDKYPYGLIGDDFGILNLKDLAINTCRTRPTPFSHQESTEYPYWQCFEIKKSKLICDGYRYWGDFGTFVTLLVITAKNEETYHEYLSRKVISYRSCQDYKKDWKHLIIKEKYICISGSYIYTKKDSQERMVSSWIFDKFKTKNGCIPYFYGDCSLKYQIKHGCKLDWYKKYETKIDKQKIIH